MGEKTGKLRILLPLVGFLLLFWFIWPTPYEYTRKAPDIFRVNRFTGSMDKATPDGWRSVKDLASEEKRLSEQLELERSKTQQEQLERVSKLAELKFLSEYLLGGINTKCGISFRESRIRFRVTLTNSERIEAVLSSNTLHTLGVNFVDDQGFNIAKKNVLLSDFIRITGENGKTDSYRFEGDIILSQSDFENIRDWSPTFNW